MGPLRNGAYRPPDQDTAFQCELWTSALERKPPSFPTKSVPRCLPKAESVGVEAALESRGVRSRLFEFEQAVRRHDGSVGKAVNPGVRKDVTQESIVQWTEPSRPPCGSAYQYTSCSWPHSSIAEKFGGSRGSTIKTDAQSGADETQQYLSRSDRIKALQEGMLLHDEDRLKRIGKGTNRLMTADEVLPLPVPPLDEPVRSRYIPKHPAISSTASPKTSNRGPQTIEDVLAPVQILGREARSHFKVLEEEDVNCGVEAASNEPRRAGEKLPPLQTYQEWLRDAESYVANPGSKEPKYWTKLALELSAHAYEASPEDVLRMVRTAGSAARGVQVASCKKELLRTVEHLLGALSPCLPHQDLGFLAEVAEVMTDVGVGSQIFLDALMAQILARHHGDFDALNMKIASRLAGALSQLSQALRLRPHGVGGPSTSTNLRVMEILQQRIQEQVSSASFEDLAHLDGRYLTRLCCIATRNAVLMKLAEEEFGLRVGHAQYLPLALKVQQVLQSELGESFVFQLPASSRGYFEQLKVENSKKHAPWTLR